MEILAGLAMAGALLYFWLLGHWFARVLMFLGLEIIALFCFFPMSFVHPAFIAAGFVFLVGGWPVATLPKYYWRRQSWAPAAASETFR